jgi:DtxR family Mn-dependent transcriptional regulator
MANWADSCHDPVDEILETMWMLEEDEIPASRSTMQEAAPGEELDLELLGKLVRDGLLAQDGKEYQLSPEGRKRAESVIRRHRLAERLLVDVLGMREVSIETNACAFEHFLSPEVTDHICTLLGHPKQCPHGRAIPPGPCCERARTEVETAVVPLSEVRAGEQGRIVYISTTQHQRLDRLTSLGLFPGRIIKVHQREPLFVIFLDETQLALEREIVEEIFVLRN